MKKIFLLLLFVLLLSGCGKIATEKDMIKYAERLYGGVKLISYKSDETSSNAVFKDKKYKFTFNVNNHKTEIIIDGTRFGSTTYYQDNYGYMLISYLKGKTDNGFNNISKKYDCSIKWDSDYKTNVDLQLVSVSIKDENNAKTIAKQVAKELQKQDKKKVIGKSFIGLYKDDNMIGKYYLDNNEYISKQ